MNNPQCQPTDKWGKCGAYIRTEWLSHKSKSSQGSGRWLRWGTACHASMNIWWISRIQVKVGLSGISTWSTTEAERRGLWCPCPMRDPDSKYKVEELEGWLQDKEHGLLFSRIRAQLLGTTLGGWQPPVPPAPESWCQMHIPIRPYTEKTQN